MRIGNYTFTPTLVPTLATIFLLALLLWLGNWQMGKADFKFKDRLAREKVDRSKIIALEPTMQKTEKILAHHVRFKGWFDAKHQAVLANIKYKRRPGFFLLTPVRIANSDHYVLLMRGWLKQTHGFNVLPDLPSPPADEVEINAIVEMVPVVGLKKGAPDEGYPKWPKLLSYVDMNWYSKVLGLQLMPYVLREKGESQAGLVRDWDAFVSASVSMPPEKHLSYAFQWFSLAAVLFIIFIVVNTRRMPVNNEMGCE